MRALATRTRSTVTCLSEAMVLTGSSGVSRMLGTQGLGSDGECVSTLQIVPVLSAPRDPFFVEMRNVVRMKGG
ncbi:hypothetical protein MTO96_026257 [Rhipicephalus appendiculatus]